MKIKKIKKIKDQAKITEPNKTQEVKEIKEIKEIKANEANETQEVKVNEANETQEVKVKEANEAKLSSNNKDLHIEDNNEEDNKSNMINDKIKHSDKDKHSYFKITIQSPNFALFKSLSAPTYICNQVFGILMIVILVIHFFNCKIYDFVIYFSFGIAISILCIATAVLVSRFNIMRDKKYMEQYHRTIITFYNKYTNLSLENIGIVSTLLCYLYHIVLIVIALLYVKNYIKSSKRSNNTYIFSYILFFIYILANLYLNDIYNIYVKPFEITNNEYNLSLITITFTYSGLLYYFENIKNENYRNIKI